MNVKYFSRAPCQPVMERLYAWLNKQIDDRLVEPNSGLGKAINYMTNHWEKLTLFLRKPGAPIGDLFTKSPKAEAGAPGLASLEL